MEKNEKTFRCQFPKIIKNETTKQGKYGKYDMYKIKKN